MGNCCSSSENKISKKIFILSESLTGHEGKITSIIELENTQIVTGSNIGEIKIWNLQYLSCDKTLKTENQILCLLEFIPNMLLTGGSSNDINLWDISQSLNELIYTFKGHDYWVNNLVKCNEKIFASSSNDGTIRIWDYFNLNCINILDNNNLSILSLIKLNNGKLCAGNIDSTIKIWDWNNNICETIYEGHAGFIKCLCQLKNGDIVSGSDDNTIKIWKSEKIFYELIGHNKAIRCLCQISDEYLASSSFDNTIKIWDLFRNICIQTLEGHKDFVTGVIFHSIGDLISCSNDKTIKIWRRLNDTF